MTSSKSDSASGLDKLLTISRHFYCYQHRSVRVNRELVCQCVVECSGLDFLEKIVNADMLMTSHFKSNTPV